MRSRIMNWTDITKFPVPIIVWRSYVYALPVVFDVAFKPQFKFIWRYKACSDNHLSPA